MGGGDSRPHPDPSSEYESREPEEGDLQDFEVASDREDADGATLSAFRGPAAGGDSAGGREQNEGGVGSVGGRGGDAGSVVEGEGVDGRSADEVAARLAARATVRASRGAMRRTERASDSVEEEMDEAQEAVARTAWRLFGLSDEDGEM